jgi:ATPase subunit of ABC transporter with duplicated ATPase domains
LASVILQEADFMILDEPTNHLDLEGVLWLEKLLLDQKFSFLMITHDRRFLESVSTRVIELNKRYEDGHFSSVGMNKRAFRSSFFCNCNHILTCVKPQILLIVLKKKLYNIWIIKK